MSTKVLSTVEPAPLRIQQQKMDGFPKCLKNLTGNVIGEAGIGWLRETPVRTSVEEMRKRYLEDGYVFIKKLIPRDDVVDVREESVVQLSENFCVLWNDK